MSICPLQAVRLYSKSWCFEVGWGVTGGSGFAAGVDLLKDLLALSICLS